MTGRPLAVPVPEVNKLLDTYLPHVHPSALKHEYLTSVVNAMIHQEAHTERFPDGSYKCIGFADYRRNLPLILIVDEHPTLHTRISHAFLPNMNDTVDRQLVMTLQDKEHAWARARGLDHGRNIVRYLTNNNSRRDGLNGRGLPEYNGNPFTEADRIDAHTQWYPTTLIDDKLTIDTRDGQMVHVYEDYDAREKIEENISRSVNSTLRTTVIHEVDGLSRWPDEPSPEAEVAATHGPRVRNFTLDDKAAQHNILRRGHIRIEFDDPPTPDDSAPDFEL